jgi:NADP-reducing hydrogenase subunit HndD
MKKECLSCIRSETANCRSSAKDFGVTDEEYYNLCPSTRWTTLPASSIRDNGKCILCRRCTAACEKQQGIGHRTERPRLRYPYRLRVRQKSRRTACVNCGQCIVACPTGALHEKDETDKVWAALSDPSKYVIVNTAPSVRATHRRVLRLPVGTDVQKAKWLRGSAQNRL